MSECAIGRLASLHYNEEDERLEFTPEGRTTPLWYPCSNEWAFIRITELAMIASAPPFFVYRAATGQLTLEPKLAIIQS